MKSLYSTILRNYTYEELERLCLDPDFAILFDCDWGIWRDKAQADFGISPQFFDLVRSNASNGIRTPSGPQRYLQISSYIKLTPLSCALSCEKGVYEEVTGFREARYRKDKEGLLWFAQRIKPEQDEEIKRTITSYENSIHECEKLTSQWSEEERELVYPPEDGNYTLQYLWFVILRGRIDILDRIIHRYFVLPKGFSIEKDVPRTPFWQIYDEQGKDLTIMHNLPLQELDVWDFNYLVRPILASGDTRIADFFRSIFRDRDFNSVVKTNHLTGFMSLVSHGKPEEAYGMDLRFLNKESYKRSYTYDYMIESSLYALSLGASSNLLIRPEKDTFVYSALGNIPYLISLLSLVPQDKENISRMVEEQSLCVLYPLSIKLLQNHLDRM
nr:hypothetical protein Clen_131 [Cedratvirus lena]